jgi:hypothetical protein
MARKRNPKYIVDILLFPFVLIGANVLKYIRRKGMGRKGMVRFPLCRKLLFKIGVFPMELILIRLHKLIR